MDINGMFIRNVLFPYMEILKGNNIRRYLSGLLNTQHLTGAELMELQGEKLKNLLLHCIKNVPAYTACGNLAAMIQKDPFSALKEFPVLTKQDFNSSKQYYLSRDAKKENLIPNCTGGSTGEPVRFNLDRKTVEYYEAVRWRGLSWWNISIGERSAMIWGSPLELNKRQKFKYRLKERLLKNRVIIPAYDLNPGSLDRHMHLLNSYKPHYIYGYASALHIFAQLMLKKGLSLYFVPKGVVSTAETLHDFQRNDIEKAFGCAAINEYGARDGGILAYQCPEGRMHLSAENAWIEIVDMKTYRPLKAGSEGLVLVTDLNNLVMPRLRYRVGDVASLSGEKCACGLGLPVLEAVQGREDDTFVTADGRFIHGHFFNHIARNLNSIRQFQVIQHSVDRLTLKIIRSDVFDASEIERFTGEIANAMGPVDIAVEYVEDIPLSDSGKFRYAVRDFTLEV